MLLDLVGGGWNIFLVIVTVYKVVTGWVIFYGLDKSGSEWRLGIG